MAASARQTCPGAACVPASRRDHRGELEWSVRPVRRMCARRAPASA